MNKGLAYLARKTGVIWFHWHQVFSLNFVSEIGNNVTWIVVGDLRGPTSSNSVNSIDQNHWDDRHIMLRFDSANDVNVDETPICEEQQDSRHIKKAVSEEGKISQKARINRQRTLTTFHRH